MKSLRPVRLLLLILLTALLPIEGMTAWAAPCLHDGMGWRQAVLASAAPMASMAAMPSTAAEAGVAVHHDHADCPHHAAGTSTACHHATAGVERCAHCAACCGGMPMWSRVVLEVPRAPTVPAVFSAPDATVPDVAFEAPERPPRAV